MGEDRKTMYQVEEDRKTMFEFSSADSLESSVSLVSGPR